MTTARPIWRLYNKAFKTSELVNLETELRALSWTVSDRIFYAFSDYICKSF